jgi:hypothetical protein
MIIEKGINKDGIECWYVLDGANLVGIYNTLEEAKNMINNG